MVYAAAKQGLTLWFEQLIPALFPFLILSNLLLYHTTKKQLPSGKFVFPLYIITMGHFCGYPMGAKLAADTYMQSRISKRTATFLIMASAQASPAFISSYFCRQMLPTKSLGLASLFLLYGLEAVLLPVFWLGLGKFQKQPQSTPIYLADQVNFMEKLDHSIMDSFSTLIRVGGYVILFAIIQRGFCELFSAWPELAAIGSSFFEITGGLATIKGQHMLPCNSYPIMMAVMAFGGFSSLAQIKGMLIGTSLSVKPYLLYKCTYAILIYWLSKLLFVII